MGGLVNQPWPAQLNCIIWSKRVKETPPDQPHKSLILLIGQVMPHEVTLYHGS